MTKSIDTKIQKFTPYITSFVLAIIGVVVKANQLPVANIEYFLFQLTFYTIIFLSIWFLNLRIKKLKWYLILFINCVIIGLYSLITYNVFKTSELPYLFYLMRVLMPSILLFIIQYSINSQKHNQKLIIENLQLKTENYKAELENLKNQLNPHFLFNSLTTLQTVIRKNPAFAEEYVIKLSELYRNMLQKNLMTHVKFKDELAFVESYIFLQKTRFKNGLKFEKNIREESLSYSIPTLSFQLLIENCIKHNIVSDEKPLCINITQNDLTSITVTNNLQPKILKEESTKTGLANLIRRYELIGIKDGVIIKKTDKEFSVTLKFF